jgi:hypothetical protein
MSKFSKYNNVLEGPFRHAERVASGELILRFRTADGQCGSIVRSGDGKPARKVQSGWQERPTFRLASGKIKGTGEAESRLEAEAYRMFDFDRTVASYETQPFTVNYETDGRTISTYPDAELKLVDGWFEIVQIKMQKTYEKHLRENARFRAEREVFERLGWSYRVLTENDIRAEPQLSNLKLLRHYRNRPVSPEIVQGVIATVRKNPNATIRSVAEAFRAGGMHVVDLYALVARHEIRADLSLPIGPEARLIVPT